MEIIKIYQDHNIPYYTEGRNVSPGWVNIQCCWCDDRSNHLGYNMEEDYFRCWKCGWHPTTDTLVRLLKLDRRTVFALIKEHGGKTRRIPRSDDLITVRTKGHKLPSNSVPLLPAHKRYLKKRLFDPNEIAKEWGVLGTGPISHLDGISFNHRIIIPINWNKKRISFVARDITNRHPLRYITCPKPREVIHHKTIIYGNQEKWSTRGICVEGVTDVWRLGPSAFATFGIEFTPAQIRTIWAHFREVIVLFDNEPQAQEKAQKLVTELKARNVIAWKETVPVDPGSLNQDEADYLVKQIMN